MSTPSSPSENSEETAISAFDKLDQASLSYNQNHHADLSSIVAEVPQHLSKLISHAAHLKEKCQNARTLFQNVIDLNLEVIASKRNDNGNNEPTPIERIGDEPGFPTEHVPEVRGRGFSIETPSYIGRPDSPEMVTDVTKPRNDDPTTRPPTRFVQDGVDDAATLALTHHQILQMAHDAQDGIFFLHYWAVVFQFEEELRQERALNDVRRVLPKSQDVLTRSYTKRGVPLLDVISGVASISEIESQNRVLSEQVLIADLFISFYSEVIQTLQFVHDNLDSFRTVHRKLSEEMKLVSLDGDDRRDVLRQAVLATSEAYDAVKGL